MFAGFGCGGVFAILLLLGLLVARNEEIKHPGARPVPPVLAATAALDSLRNFDLRSLAGSIRRHFLGHELKSFEVLAGVLRM